jgi:4-hydroxy-3-methylbut-2-enyl diphosphate reductase IspH
MKRFHPTSRAGTLQHKAINTLEERRFMPPGAAGPRVQVAAVLGMDQDARIALERLLAMAERRRVGVAGRFMKDEGVARLLVERGIVEEVAEEDFFRFQRVAIPYCGVAARDRRAWEEAGVPLEDFTAPQVRRAQVALGLLRMEGASGLVIGRHDDAESLAIAGACPGAAILEDTTDTARLRYSPAFGVVCQTTLSPRRIAWLVEQLRFRYRDARVSFLDTVCQSMARREEALERLLPACDRVLIVGEPDEASCDALAETAMRRGKPAAVVKGAEGLAEHGILNGERIALTAGAFVADETIRKVAEALAG